MPSNSPTFFINITLFDGELVERIAVREHEIYKSLAWLTAEIKEAMERYLTTN